MAIPPETRQQIQHLLNTTTLSRRQIAKIVQVGKDTVANVANGTYKPLPPKSNTHYPTLTPTRPPQRCPTCGNKTQVPCYICHIRQHKPKLPTPQTPSTPLKLQLEGDDLTRYNRLRHKQQEENNL